MEYIFLGVDSLIVTSLYYFYRKKCYILTNIKVVYNLIQKSKQKYMFLIFKMKRMQLN